MKLVVEHILVPHEASRCRQNRRTHTESRPTLRTRQKKKVNETRQKKKVKTAARVQKDVQH